MPASDLRRFCLSSETSWGTSTSPATAKLMGVKDGSLKIDDKVENIKQLGQLGPGTINAHLSQSGSGSVTLVPSYEDILYPLHGVFGNTGTTSTSTSTGIGPFVWNYNAPHQTAPTPCPFFLEYGTTDANYSADGVLFSKLNIKGEAGGYWEMTADYVAKSVANATSTSGLSSLVDRTVTPIMMSDTRVYIDTLNTTSTGAGQTEVVATLIDFALDIDPKLHLKQFSGSINPAGYGYAVWEGGLKTTLEFNSTSKAYVTSLFSTSLTPVTKFIRIKATDPSTSTGVQTCKFDIAGVLKDGVELFKDRDGNITMELNWAPTFSTLLNTWCAVTVESHSSRLPSS